MPLLDLELMEFVEGLPIDLRLKGWAGHKYLYRTAVRRWLGDEIMRRPKIGFTTPMAEWLRGPLAGVMRERVAAAGSACAQYFDARYIQGLIDQHLAGRDQSRALYALLVFEYWHEQFMVPHGSEPR